MKHYLLTVFQPEGGQPPPPEELEQIFRNVEAFHQELKDAGAWVFSGGLHAPDTATVLRADGSETLMTDGPFVEGKEHIGGFLIVQAPDLDAALEWARRLASALVLPGQPDGLPVEVRPFRGELER